MLILGLWARIFREPMPEVFLFFGIPVQLFAGSGVGSTLDGCAMLRIFQAEESEEPAKEQALDGLVSPLLQQVLVHQWHHEQ